MSAAMTTIQTATLLNNLDQVIMRLGFANHPGLIRSWKDYKGDTNRHILRQAFNTIGVHAVFGFSSHREDYSKYFSPILYFAAAKSDKEANSIHRQVWSQGIVPILIIATPDNLQVRKSLAPPQPSSILIPWDKLVETQTQALPPQLFSLTALSLSTSIVWNDFAANRRNRVDRALLDAIRSLNTEVCLHFPKLSEHPDLINAVIGRFIYFFVLLDRGIVTPSWISALIDKHGKPLCKTISDTFLHQQNDGSFDSVWPAKDTWALFDRIDTILNGSIFPIKARDRQRIPSGALHLIRRAIRHGDILEDGTRQLGFLDVSFATLRTETISAIYELFLHMESSSGKSDDGAFYTPPFLVDYILDQVDQIRQFSRESRTLDPAAGSGIFLVGAYRRILERTIPNTPFSFADLSMARELLEQLIFGIEHNPQAANVTRFSLYLTMLDYADNISIEELSDQMGGESLFPSLCQNIVNEDAFTINAPNKRQIGQFTHVVGNPPWHTIGKRANRKNAPTTEADDEPDASTQQSAKLYFNELDPFDCPVVNKRLSELFVWKILRDFLAPDGVLGLLVSTRSFVARTAHSFPNALARTTKLVGLANMSHFRYRLFKGSRSPAIAVFAQASEPTPLDVVWVYTPLLTSQPIGRDGHLWSIFVSDTDIRHYRLRDFTNHEDGWFRILMLRPLDQRFSMYLRLWSDKHQSTFGDFVERTGLKIKRGGSPAQTGLSDRLLLGATDWRSRLGLLPFSVDSYPHDEIENSEPYRSYTELFSGNIVLIPRHMKDVTFVSSPIAFRSSFNGLYAPEGTALSTVQASTMRSVSRFLNSNVARYLYTLFGKTWLLDRARLERNDLMDIPFPFEGLEDAELEQLSRLDEMELTTWFARRVGLSAIFVVAVQEYTNLRCGYEDSQIPASSFQSPHRQSLSDYEAVLKEQLLEEFGPETAIRCNVMPPVKYSNLAVIDVGFSPTSATGQGLEGQSREPVTDFMGKMGFNPYTHISYSPSESYAALTKPWTQVAWTIEQAYADALSITEEVLRSRSR